MKLLLHRLQYVNVDVDVNVDLAVGIAIGFAVTVC